MLFDSNRIRMKKELLRNLKLTAANNNSHSIFESFLKDLCFWQVHGNAKDGTAKHHHNGTTTTTTTRIKKAKTNVPTMQEAMDMDLEGHFEDAGCDSSVEEEPQNNNNSPKSRWKKAIDPASGKTYYYDVVTRKTQWNKPAELKEYERRKRKERRRIAREFFDEMETNILQSLSRGEVIPGIPPEKTKDEGPPQEPLTKSHVRTISAMHGVLLEELGLDGSSNHSNNNATETKTKPQQQQQQQQRLGRRDNERPKHPPTVRTTGPLKKGRPPLPGSRYFTEDANTRSRNRSPQKDTEHNALPPRQSIEEKSEEIASTIFDSELAGEKLLDAPIHNDLLELQDDLSDIGSRPPVGHTRRNTGGTIYLQNFMTNPNINATIKCVCGVYRAHIGQSTKQPQPQTNNESNNGSLPDFDVFHDNIGSPRKKKSATVPTLTEILEFYEAFYQRSQMEHDTIIFSLIYVERLIKSTNGRLSPSPRNWRSFLFSCMVLASKVWDDLSMWNNDFANVTAHTIGFTSFTLARINELELALLKCLSFNVKVTASEYAKYYFLIRTMLLRSGLVKEDEKPLGKREALEKLESLTSPYFDRCSTNEPRDRRSKSMDGGILNALPGEDLKNAIDPVLNDSICLEQLVN